ncbi:Thymidylate kinase [Micromonospora nigra]|uniref:Thymidylate kinase n=1 Tax=Micromonospora nigra TaxID=145857 RepID=A0A1C6R839_9ACTN|nr:dTMP kinase [Micromonospora nigra]SCL13079.1 Thymidylate kinase [Micromonospora nigra]
MLIAFEGLPGAGKTTQSRALAAFLSHRRAVTYLPDNLTRDAAPLGRTLLSLFDSGDPFSRHDSVVTDTYLAAAIRADTYATHIASALGTGSTVIEDRGLHTLYSYSLAGLLQKHRTPPQEAIVWLQQVGALAGPAADRSVWLRLPSDDAIARAEQRQRHPYTDEQRAFLRYVHDAYTALAETAPDLRVVDVSGLSTDDTHQAVLAAVDDLILPSADLSPIS